MKKLFLILLCLCLIPFGVLFADTITLNTPETLSVPTAPTLKWKIILIDAEEKMLRIAYQWRDAFDDAVRVNNQRDAWYLWDCRTVIRDNAQCIAEKNPWSCCTGAGTGDCTSETCFDDVFKFQIRAQDEGTMIGVGLRTLIWNQFKQDILTPGNDGTFNE